MPIAEERVQDQRNSQVRELPDVQASFRKGRRTRDQIANIRWIIEKAKEFQKSICFYKGFPCSSVSKESACSAGDPVSIPGLGRSPGEGNGKPLQYSCLENTMDRGFWWATIHGIARVGHYLVTKLPPPKGKTP